MKKTIIVLIAVIVLFVSCTSEQNNLYYYGFFSDKAVMIAYSAKNNTVYDISLPLDAIISWGIGKGIENIPNAIRSFCNYKDEAFMFGSSDAFNSVVEINKAVKEYPLAFGDQILLENLNKMCSADFSALAKVVTENKPEFVSLDTEKFTEYNNPEYAKLYITNWLKQVIGE